MMTIVIKAQDPKKGMSLYEVQDAINTAVGAAGHGIYQLKRTRVGFRGQIIEMIFTREGQ